jgi:hypothetical protein
MSETNDYRRYLKLRTKVQSLLPALRELEEDIAGNWPEPVTALVTIQHTITTITGTIAELDGREHNKPEGM